MSDVPFSVNTYPVALILVASLCATLHATVRDITAGEVTAGNVMQVTGVLERDDFMDKYQAMDGVLYARPLVKPGSKCVSVADGMPTWMAEVMVTKKPVQDAIKWIEEMEVEVTASMPITPAA